MLFEDLELAPTDPIFGLEKLFLQDSRKEKEYLCVGVYQDEDRKMPVFNSIKKAKKKFLEDTEIANYLSFEGIDSFNQAIGELIFSDQWEDLRYRTYVAETLGGTGALRVGSEFISDFITKNAFVSNPTWPNHLQVLKKSGMEVFEYPYLSKKYQVDFDHMLSFISKIPEKSLVVLQACCHNPTGADLSSDQWKELSSLMLKRNLIPFFDSAYHGLGSGLDEDAKAIRLFAKDGHEMLVSYTCSKNFSLYSHRTGCLFIVTASPSQKDVVASQVNRVIRASYSNPTRYGASLVSTILKSDELRKMWKDEIGHIQKRLTILRKTFVDLLNKNPLDKNFDYILMHKGMFSFLDINQAQVKDLREKYGVYLSKNGRMNFAGLNKENMQFVVDSIIKVLR